MKPPIRAPQPVHSPKRCKLQQKGYIMAKKLITISELAQNIIRELETNLCIPECLEYLSPNLSDATGKLEIHDIEFDVTAAIEYGTCEGTYVTVYAIGQFMKDPAENKKVELFTAKTLDTDFVTLSEMGKLAGRCVYYGNLYVKTHQKELCRRGYECKEKAEDKHALIVQSREKALAYKSKGYQVIDLYTQQTL